MNKSRKTALSAALKAGKLIAHRLGDVGKLDYKSKANIVTDVDKASEAIILEIIRNDFPDDEILAEESGRLVGNKTHRIWLIDPLDGTTNFAHSYPFFAVSIALVENSERVLGVVFNPISDELFWAERGEGAWLNHAPIQVSETATLEESLLATGFAPNTPQAERVNFEHFKSLTTICHGVRRDGSAALDLCYVACGRLDGFWERKLAPWDLGAGTLIVEEAGGKISDLENKPFDLVSGHVLATNSLIHQEVVSALDESKITDSV